MYLVTVLVEQLQRNITLQKILLLGKTVFSVRQKGVPPLLLPTSVLQLPRCLVRICNLFLINHKIANLTVSKMQLQQGKQIPKIKFASQMWATRPHLANIFKKLLDQKTFVCLRLILGKPLAYDSARLGHIPSLPWESQLSLKPCISLQPSDFEGNCDSFDSLLDFTCGFLCSFICSANVGCSPTPRQHF